MNTCNQPMAGHTGDDSSRAVRRIAASIALAALMLGAAASSRADDTEVFFDASSSAATNPNILFVLPTGRTMGCEMGATGTCAEALQNGNSRMDVVKNALIIVMKRLIERDVGVNIGLMRGRNNGSDGSNAAKGGFIAQEVAPVTADHLEDLTKWICPYGMNKADCNLVMPNGSGNGQLMLAPSNDPSFSKLGSGKQQLTEILFEANRYFASRRPDQGMGAEIGPSYDYPGKLYTPSTIWGPSVKVPGSCPGNNCIYKSPANLCQTNFIIVLSDGILSSDVGNDTGANSISSSAGDPAPYNKWFKPYVDSDGLTTLAGTACSKNTGISYKIVDPTSGKVSKDKISDCSDDLVYSMRNGGFVDGKPGAQVFTYTVGFDITAATTAEGTPSDAPRLLLQMLARAGGGKFYQIDCDNCDPGDAAEDLADLFEKIVDEVVISNASFTSPAVSVNSFNRTQNLNELYMSVFRPSTTARWNGNVKKYRLAPNGDITGRDSSGRATLAVNALKGVFLPSVGNLWPKTPVIMDGDDVLAGGAARSLKSWNSRTIYTNQGGTAGQPLVSIDEVESDPDAADVLGYKSYGLNLTPPDCPASHNSVKADADNPAICHLVDWIRGADVQDVMPRETKDGSGNTIPAGNADFDDERYDLGDPLHTRPAVIVYGGDATNPQTVVYAVTNDGFLHSFDPDTGEDNWSFIPWDRLDRMASLYINDFAKPRTSLGLDGTIRTFKLDKDRDGIVETSDGDRVILYFGMRRGGHNYYAVDVTDKTAPELLWVAGKDELPGIGQTWSRPVVTRMRVPGHDGDNDTVDTSDDNYVIMFAGGYDEFAQDSPDGKPRAYADQVPDTKGRGVYMLDAFTGTLLWRAGPDSGANLQLAAMTASMPADLSTLDLTNDGYVDLLYIGDLKGRVWRLDFVQAAANVASMATGGIFADLGGTGVAGARRFFTSPDVSSVIQDGESWFNIAIGSGNREMPLSDGCTTENLSKYPPGDCEETDDRFYSLRDYKKLVPYDWDIAEAITEADLTDVTPTLDVATGVKVQAAVPAGSAGWMLHLDTFAGEKSISPSRTFDNTIFFPTFIPLKRSEDTDNDACTEALGYNNLYEVSVYNAKPSKYLEATVHNVVAGGLAIRLDQFGIAPEIVLLFPGAAGGDSGSKTRPPPVCLIGVESCGSFTAFEPKRTYWRQRGAE